MPIPIEYGTGATDAAFDKYESQLVEVAGSGPIESQYVFNAAATSMPGLMLSGAGGPLQRGIIYQDKNDPAVTGVPLGMAFLYNPTSFEVDYSLDTSRYPSSDPTIGVPGAASVSFDLILDRTFDVNDKSKGDAYHQGIQVDVTALEKIVGYTQAKPFVQAVAVWVNFGNPILSYYGFITSFSVVYTQFTYDMRPYRGAISGITLQILPENPPNTTYQNSINGISGQAASTAANIDGTGTGTDGSGS